MDRENEIWDVPGHADFLLNDKWNIPGTERGRHADILSKTASLVTTDHVLDAGCGMGHFIPFLLKVRPDVSYWGFDNSKEMLLKAKEFFPSLNERFSYGDIYDMSNFAVFPTVVCIDILIHLPEIETPIKELWRHTTRELIIVTRIGSSSWIGRYGNTGKFVFPEGKKLISRGDTRDDYMRIFEELHGTKSIDEHIYDERSTIFRLTRT
jgi:SAM-dependent methyltransferase